MCKFASKALPWSAVHFPRDRQQTAMRANLEISSVFIGALWHEE
jgi:hypothetical protein